MASLEITVTSTVEITYSSRDELDGEEFGTVTTCEGPCTPAVVLAPNAGSDRLRPASPFDGRAPLITPLQWIGNNKSYPGDSSDGIELTPYSKAPYHNHNTGVTLTSFDQYFNLLPLEMRLKIWDCVIEPEIPGIVEIAMKSKNDSAEYRRLNKKGCEDKSELRSTDIQNPQDLFECITTSQSQFDIRPLQRIPSVLHICRESRMEGLHYYKLELGLGAWHLPRTYVKCNPMTEAVIDTICIRFPHSGRHKDNITKLSAQLQHVYHGAVRCLERYNITRIGIIAEPAGKSRKPMVLTQARLCNDLPNISHIYVIDDDRPTNHLTTHSTAEFMMKKAMKKKEEKTVTKCDALDFVDATDETLYLEDIKREDFFLNFGGYFPGQPRFPVFERCAWKKFVFETEEEAVIAREDRLFRKPADMEKGCEVLRGMFCFDG